MWKKNTTAGFFVAVDGPNGAGKSTLISAVKQKMESKGIAVHVTKEPTNTELGSFTRQFAEKHSGKSLLYIRVHLLLLIGTFYHL